ncbi:hypothetical protein IA64_16760 [Xanthomonas arboricola pv. celebensis]|nr:hypothetical protein IA64_16760 [Xanthomonas arboricola pv. celebensis]
MQTARCIHRSRNPICLLQVAAGALAARCGKHDAAHIYRALHMASAEVPQSHQATLHVHAC